MSTQFLDKSGLQKVAENVNTRLKTVDTLPLTADDGTVLLYKGVDGAYVKGCTYQYNATDDEWVNITPSLAEQHYNPESKNAVSSNAVDEACSLLFDKLFKVDTWTSKTWGGQVASVFTGDQVWTDGDDWYISTLKIDLSTSSLVYVNWQGLNNIDAQNIWSDGVDTYYSNMDSHYKLNKDTYTWVPYWEWQYNRFQGCDVWTDGDDIYVSRSSTQYVLNKQTYTWDNMDWGGWEPNGVFIWTDNVNIYQSWGDTNKVLDKKTKRWNTVTFNGENDINGSCVWNDGFNSYFSYGATQLKLNRQKLLWEPVVWDGLPEFYGNNIWIPHKNTVYLSISRTSQYQRQVTFDTLVTT